MTVVGHQVGHEVGHAVGVSLGSSQPAPIALGALAWWDPDPDYIDTDVGVRDWTDRIGGFIATQSTGAKQPTFQSTGPSPSGASSVRFTAASSNFMTCAASGALLSAIQTFPITVYSWGRPLANAATMNFFLFLGAFGHGLIDQWSTDLTAVMNFGSGSTYQSVVQGSWAVGADLWQYGSYVNSTNRRARLRGNAEGVATSSLAWGTASTTLLFASRTASGSQFWDGHMYGAAIFPKACTAAEHARMQAFIDDQLGI